MKKFYQFISLLLLAALFSAAQAQDKNTASDAFSGLKLREIGPAITSGRISDFAMHPQRWHEYYVATASGGLWKTNNNGISWQAIFDNEASYSIGVVELDPADPLTVWVGTGENNSQRSVAYGDGVYKSQDGGSTWKNVGLKNSEHISQIGFDPRDSSIVFVAAQGPLWNDGGDRGLYRSKDSGQSWDRILHIDKHTGVNEFVIHPQHPDRMIASSYQRRRHVWTLINGGPGSGIHKSTDGGASWREITAGLPKTDMGRIGLAMAPSAPDTVYAIIESDDENKGVYRSTDFGENWKKRSDYMTSSPQYYNELVVDPINPDRLYAMDTFARISEDGAKTWRQLSIEHKHVDDHALWIDPENTEHLIIGGDGGIYDSWDRGETWRHMQNLSITQFYRATPDNSEPFYYVYGGTQDNNTLGAPSRTTNVHGISNADWLMTLGGDGFKPRIDPTDPNIVYSQYQYGNLARYDRRNGERVFITPQPDKGEPQLRWNWNAPLLISYHDPARLYYGAKALFRSDDRGDSWRRISGDLSRDLDRNMLPVMGRVWGVDTIAKNKSTSLYGSLIALAESPFDEKLLYAGSDDGLIHVTNDGGESWRKIKRVRGVPEMALVEDIESSVHEAKVAYAVFDNHKRGDFKPYVFITRDQGRSWSSITGDLPERGTVHAIAEDHVDPKLLFAGTEFGLYFTQNGGKNWHKVKGGFPTIAVRDLEIQRRETDLVIATFGRGIWIMDDYSPLRTTTEQLTRQPATLFGARDTWLYIEADKWGSQPKGSQGADFYQADNPPFGAVFSYYLRDGIKSRRELRREAEDEKRDAGDDTAYPSWDSLREEDREAPPAVYLVVKDQQGNLVRRVKGSGDKGFHRVAWDLRLPAANPVSLEQPAFRPPWVDEPFGPLVLPGQYTASLVQAVNGSWTELSGPLSFKLKALDTGAAVAEDREQLQQFQATTAQLQRAVLGAGKAVAELQTRMDHLEAALLQTPKAGPEQFAELRQLQLRLVDIRTQLEGDKTISGRSEAAPWSLNQRVNSIIYGHWKSQAAVTETHQTAYQLAAEQFETVLEALKKLASDLARAEQAAEKSLAPWTPGRIPNWHQDD